MYNIKVSASFVLPGRTLLAEQPCSKNGKTKEKKEKMMEEEMVRNDKLSYHQETIYLKDKRLIINLRDAIPARQNLHLSEDAYNYMIAPENPVPGMKVFEWKRLTKTKRVRLHLEEIAKNFRGTLESFSVLED